MNYDINTPEGMANAVQWTENLVSILRDGGTWCIPWSMTLVTLDKTKMVANFHRSEPSVERVFRAMGWEVINK